MIRRVCALAALACLLAVAGCGSSGGTHSASASASASSTTTSAASASSTTSAQTTTGSSKSPSDVDGKLDELPKTKESSPGPTAPTGGSGNDRSYLETVFKDAQNFWRREFSQAGITYQPARLAMFTRTTHSGCGVQEDTGPFYCPADRTVYLDLSFFGLLSHQAGIGPFGLAYIVAHEMGHHVQNLMGISNRVAAANQQNPGGENALSVRVELQADCLAGVWGASSYSRHQLTEADLKDALKTAAIVGDDFQQSAAGQEPDSAGWTHGSSQQRQHWLSTGFDKADPNACNTFTSNDA